MSLEKNSLDMWIHDELCKILGYSQKTIVDYVKAMASSAKSFDKLIDGLQDIDMTKDQSELFAKELQNKLGIKPPTN
jgi:methylaspartate ammonia-lyase